MRSGHPRVLVSPEDLPRLRRLAQTTHRAEMESLLRLAETETRSPGSGGEPAPVAWRLGFLYLLTGDKAHAAACAKAVDALLALNVDGSYAVGSARIRAMACAYDWCHDALPPLQREFIGHRALAYSHLLYSNGEVWPGNNAAGHDVNSFPPILMAAIGMSGEIFGAEPLLADAVQHTRGMLACYRHFLEGDSFSQSYSYTSTYMHELPHYFQLAETAFGWDWFSEHSWFRNCVKWWTYALRADETFIRYGDYFCGWKVFENMAYYRGLAAIAARYRDTLANWWVKRFRIQNGEPDQFLFEDRDFNEVTSPDTLPRTKLFPAMGVAIARGDFAGGTVAALKCTPVYLHNHCHRDQNQLTVYHKGDLAIDSGGYDTYESPQWYNYYIRTIAHNTIVVHDPEEEFDSRGRIYANDGGQRFINEPDFAPRNVEHLAGDAFRDGRILDYREGSGWSYVCGDASDCYRPSKLKRFLRHVVFVLDWPHKSCVSLVVLDEVELTRPGLLPRYLLHTMEEPTVDGQRIVARHGNGRLTVHVMLPLSARIEKIGGPGREFWVDGKNYPLCEELPGPHAPGAWRAEIAPASPDATSVRFLTMLIPTDAGAPEPPAPSFQEDNGGLSVLQGGLGVGLRRGRAPRPLPGRRTIEVALAQPR
ncbi:MAG: heparinase II/III family protein [Planctomycetota bacterium]|nr:heparinase II/III family protein [Planctomycetota bacterium]